jgi:site-specific DNA recombinase
MTRRNQKTADATKAVGYLRVSTDEQHLGPEAQREALERYCAAHSVELVAVHSDIGVSGGCSLDKRPGLLEGIEALSTHGAGVLLVAKRDRLARDPMVAAMVEASAKRCGARIVSAAGEGTDTDAPADILMRRMVDAFAEYERLLIAARTSAALAVKRSRNEKTGGSCPFGFQLAADGIHLERNEKEQRAIVLVRELRANGMSIRRIAQRLNDDSVPARGSKWHATTVAKLLNREAA